MTSTHTARACNNRRVCKVCQGNIHQDYSYKMKSKITSDDDKDKTGE